MVHPVGAVARDEGQPVAVGKPDVEQDEVDVARRQGVARAGQVHGLDEGDASQPIARSTIEDGPEQRPVGLLVLHEQHHDAHRPSVGRDGRQSG